MFGRSVFVICLALALSGCVSDGTNADFATVSQQIGSPKAGQSRIVVLRQKSFVGAVVGWDAKLDGAPLPSVKNGTYVYADLPAGSHMLSASEIMFPGETSMKISTAPGKTYFFLMQISERGQQLMGAQMAGGLVGLAVGAAVTSDSQNPGPYVFQPVDEGRAKSMIAELSLAN